MTSLVRSGRSDADDIDALRARLTELERALAERLAEVDRAQTSLAAFRIRYRREVGRLHEELDELEAAISEAELGERAKHTLESAGEPASTSPSAARDPLPRYTSDAVRRLFRDVAKTIHPDLARDDEARIRRHTLMVEANRAYALGDEERLRAILERWVRSPEAVQGSDPDATRQRLSRRIAEVEDQLAACAAELAALNDSALGKLKTMVDQASARGKDLVSEMVARLKRDIMVARNRLDAIRS